MHCDLYKIADSGYTGYSALSIIHIISGGVAAQSIALPHYRV